jgi:Ca2+-transporting ATPase
VTVAATDKTGTLTEGRMTVEQLVTPTAAHTLTGEGYAPEGSVSDGYGDREDLLRLARDLVLCNDADLVRDTEGSWEPVGDPMEAALVAAAYRCGLDPEVRSRYSRWAEIPFDALRRRMTTVHTTLDGTTLSSARAHQRRYSATPPCCGTPETGSPSSRRRPTGSRTTVTACSPSRTVNSPRARRWTSWSRGSGWWDSSR